MDLTSPEVLGAAAVVVTGVGALVVRALRVGRRGQAAPAGPVAPAPRDLRTALAATGRRFRERLDVALGRSGDQRFEALEEALLAADVGARTTQLLLDRVRTNSGPVSDPATLQQCLRSEVLGMLDQPVAGEPSVTPWVILVTGVNGVGKTTTIGKLAARHKAAGRKVLVVAADTFRAAAIEQLAVWAERAGADIVRHEQGADPSAVVFDGLRAARARGAQVVLVDTAGRLHTRTPLMEELS